MRKTLVGIGMVMLCTMIVMGRPNPPARSVPVRVPVRVVPASKPVVVKPAPVNHIVSEPAVKPVAAKTVTESTKTVIEPVKAKTESGSSGITATHLIVGHYLLRGSPSTAQTVTQTTVTNSIGTNQPVTKPAQ